MQPVIEIQNVSKQYRLGESFQTHGSFREVLSGALRRPFRALGGKAGGKTGRDPFWALRDVSLDVKQGDIVGILGSNGAGKSTLLKILSRITEPSSGKIKIRGRIASLLEVGTGFHPELTGRENIYLNGSILGMRKAEIEARFDEIIAFAGIDAFLDTPVKRYSSGMYVRLAFAIAAHLDPDILIVDEVLAVGDVAFQKKCLGKIAESCAKARTVLFVSHNLAAVENLCTKGVVLSHGKVVFNGGVSQAIEHYMQTSAAGEVGVVAGHVVDLGAAPGRPAKYRPRLKRIELFTEEDKPILAGVPLGAPMRAHIYFELNEACTSVDAEVAFYTLGGQRICTAHSAYEPDRPQTARVGEQVFVCEIPSLTLIPGEYKLNVGLDVDNEEVDLVEDAIRLTVTKSDYYGTGIIPVKGIYVLPNRWRLDHQMEAAVS